ncbi:hypothetical protein GCM10010191_46630 [Actinomadura vinacea]|uniref:Uncharacterized protein n=1 Tax=Actinomadura vinacea TaxID=115336 RepID=A0ABN3JEK4_9ACTN
MSTTRAGGPRGDLGLQTQFPGDRAAVPGMLPPPVSRQLPCLVPGRPYCCVVGGSIDSTQTSTMVTNALGTAVLTHCDQGVFPVASTYVTYVIRLS